MTAQRRRQRSRAWAGPDRPPPAARPTRRPRPTRSRWPGIVLRRLTAAPRSRPELAADLAAARRAGRRGDAGARPVHRGRPGRRRGLRPDAGAYPPRQPRVGPPCARSRSCGARVWVTRRRRLPSSRSRPTTRWRRPRRWWPSGCRRRVGCPYETRVRRLAGMLARKGYNAGLAHRVVRDAITAEGRGLRSTSTDSDLHVDSILDGGD